MEKGTCFGCDQEFDTKDLETWGEVGLCSECAKVEQNNAEMEKEDDEQKEAQKLGSGKFYVLKTAFHGGGTICGPVDALTAVKARNAYREGDCICGCAGIIPESEYAETRTERGNSPYSLVR